MIRYICDICGKEADDLQTMIIYKQQFQYCGNCSKRVYIIKQSFRKEMQEEYLEYEKRLIEKEKQIFDRMIKKK